jgi:hypothetical protein
MLRSLEAAYAAALLLALVVLWQQLFILRLRTELRRVALKAPKMRPAGPPLTKASMVLENLMTVAGLKKEATEMVEIAKVANLEKVLAEKTVALAKVEDQRQLDDALYEEDPARAEHMRLDVARCARPTAPPSATASTLGARISRRLRRPGACRSRRLRRRARPRWRRFWRRASRSAPCSRRRSTPTSGRRRSRRRTRSGSRDVHEPRD